jgi:hypothetical protein
LERNGRRRPGHRFELDGEVMEHHDVVHWSWRLRTPDGSELMSGFDVAANRPRDELRIVVHASTGDPTTLDAYEALGIDEVIVALDGITDPRTQLDHHRSLVERYQRSST